MNKVLMVLVTLALTCMSVQAGTVYVDVQDDYFEPYNLYVTPGTTVMWTNYGVHTHTVTDSTGMLNSGDLLPGQNYSYTFNTVGDYDYYCVYHVLVGMFGIVHVRDTADLTFLLTTIPVGGPPVIPPGGGSFSYTATLTNQTGTPQPFEYWVKAYLPNMTPYPVTGPLSATLNGGQTRSKQFTQTIPATAPAGAYHYVSYVGTMPDTVLAWSSFDFTKSAVLDMSGWESHEISDWYVASQAASTTIANPTNTSKITLSNSPEPFNPSTVISYALPSAGLAQLDVYNIAGEKVATLVDGWRMAGTHEVTFDGSGLPSGVYIYRLRAGQYTASGKMVLTK